MIAGGENPISTWLQRRRGLCGLYCESIAWDQTEEWFLRHGEISHRTGGFFSVRGLATRSNDARWNNIEQPIIHQPEIGILGFLYRYTGEELEILLQAKTEPGNVHAVQIGPSVQATVSNYTRLHGGAPTPYLDYFLSSNGAVQRIGDVAQSEQGNRFLNKFNRNVSLLVHGAGPEPASNNWFWHPVRILLPLLTTDWAVNTDARSVLCCSDWKLLATNRVPFDGGEKRSDFRSLLRESFVAADQRAEHSLSDVLLWIHASNTKVSVALQFVPLHQLNGWRVTTGGITDEASNLFHVQLFHVQADDREVSHWQQPLLASCRSVKIVLLCQERRGLLYFLVRASREIGFTRGVQLGPTAQSDQIRLNGDPLSAYALDVCAQEQLSVRQSDEGGRFYRSIANYSIKLLDETEAVPATGDTIWLTLSQLYALSKRRGRLTNELRSTLSLVLSLL